MADPADTFVECYDELDEENFRHKRVRSWLRDSWVNGHAKSIERKVLSTGGIEPALVEEIRGDGPRGLFALCIGLERALASATPHEGTSRTGNLSYLAERYVTEGRLNSETPGALLVVRAVPGAPPSQAEKETFFPVLVRVPPDAWKAMGFCRVPLRDDFPFPVPKQVDVGCVPMLATLDDILVEAVDHPDGPAAYQIKAQPHVRERVDSVLAKLDASGVMIALLPELALSNELLDEWKAAIWRNPPPPRSRLRWILLGTGPLGQSQPPENRGIILNRLTSETVLEQDKRCDFTLTGDQAATWRLGGVLGQAAREEHITRGGCLNVRESTLGRIALFICQDLDEPLRHGRAVTGAGVSHVFVPVFAPPIPEHGGWLKDAANHYAKEVGTWIVVTNSRVIGDAQGGMRFGTCIVVGPGSPDSWEPHWEVKCSTSCEEVVTVNIEPGVTGRLASVHA